MKTDEASGTPRWRSGVAAAVVPAGRYPPRGDSSQITDGRQRFAEVREEGEKLGLKARARIVGQAVVAPIRSDADRPDHGDAEGAEARRLKLRTST